MNHKLVNENETCEVFSYDEQKVKRVAPIVEGENLGAVAGIFKALADETRLKVAYALLQEEELCVCDIAHIIKASTATTSHHLRLLRNMGIAKSRKVGKLVFYSLDDEHVRTLITTGVVHGKEIDERG